MFFIIAVLLGFSQVTSNTRQFRPEHQSNVPREIVENADWCDREVESCWERFRSIGGAWVGDVNDDGQNELIVFPGSGGTGGDDAGLFEKRNGRWVQILRYFPYVRQFAILPIVRDRYRDLCLEDWRCYRWNGKVYVAYQPDAYRNISWGVFDDRRAKNATILWMVRNAGRNVFRLEPHWYSFKESRNLAKELNETGRIWAQHSTDRFGFKWVALYKAGVWGIKDGHAFLLLPRPSHTGCDRFEEKGDWLIVCDSTTPVASINRRTMEMTILTREPFWLLE